MTLTLSDALNSVLETGDALAKARQARHIFALWQQGQIAVLFSCPPPPRFPARPERPALLAPRFMPKRGRAGSLANRIALLHALAHIELNAIDLAADMMARFGQDLPSPTPALQRRFLNDWMQVMDDEARHFLMLHQRLVEMGSYYGEHPAHDGLWQAADATRHDALARLAIAPLVLEARGLDVSPQTIERLRTAGDEASAQALQIIYEDEISHVAAGVRWFQHWCDSSNQDPIATFHATVKACYKGELKPPFNEEARLSAGLTCFFYLPLAPGGDNWLKELQAKGQTSPLST